MKFRLASILLMLTFTLSVTIIAASASGMDGFKKSKEYSVSPFSDVSKRYEWYYGDVASAYEYGLITGQNGKYYPDSNVSLAQAVTFAVRIHRVYRGLNPIMRPEDNGKWYSGYTQYALENGIIQSLDLEFEKPISREMFAFYLSKSLPDEELPNINENFKTIIDFPSSNMNFNPILKLYQAGILTGSDPCGRLKPGENITRAEAAVLLVRFVIPALRIKFTPQACEMVIQGNMVMMHTGEKLQLNYTYLNQENGSEVVWHSSQPENIVISNTGEIEAKFDCNAAVWATNSSGTRISIYLPVIVREKIQAS